MRDFHSERALAMQMHREYRAAYKALGTRRLGYDDSLHDHGWEACHRKDYFLNRARRLLLKIERTGT